MNVRHELAPFFVGCTAAVHCATVFYFNNLKHTAAESTEHSNHFDYLQKLKAEM